MWVSALLKLHNILYGHHNGWKKSIERFLSYIPIMNPHAKVVQQWNQFFVISCLVAIFIDPLFFFLLSVEKVTFYKFILSTRRLGEWHILQCLPFSEKMAGALPLHHVNPSSLKHCMPLQRVRRTNINFDQYIFYLPSSKHYWNISSVVTSAPLFNKIKDILPLALHHRCMRPMFTTATYKSVKHSSKKSMTGQTHMANKNTCVY